MAKLKTSLQLSPDVVGLLEDVTSKGAYVDHLVRTRTQEIQEAIAILHQAEWSKAALAAACDILNGIWLDRSYPLGSFLAAELYDGERLNKTATVKWGVDPEAWESCVSQAGSSDPIAWALYVCVREFWALESGETMNGGFERRAFGVEGFPLGEERGRERVGSSGV